MFGIFRNFRLNGNLSQKFLRVPPAICYNNRSYYAIKIAENQSKARLTKPCCKYHKIARTMATGTSTSTEVNTTEEPPKKTNRLSLEKSPYLLQHATNPVDWFPWGDEAFEKARKENKLIFLSVGYSTCHWCHVMETESFENKTVADILNKSFVSIKVDREERPDVDKLYMTYVQRSTGGGGWPMSVFLTPNLEPVFGGTYFPPEDKYGRVGFKSLLQLIAKQWSENHVTLGVKAKSSVDAIRRLTIQSFATTEEISIPGPETLKKCTTQFLRSYDKTYGGFSDAPKFPQPSNFNYLFHVYSKDRTSEEGKAVLESCVHTLKRMAYGGIHDHVNCGFARYSVDERWHVPHFEKMLYDQAQLAVTYTEAYLATKETFFKDIADDILTYVSRDLSHDLGGFYGAEDADSYPYKEADKKQEGAFCVWEYDELIGKLKGSTDKFSYFDLFVYHFDIKKNGNVPPQYDPHNELKNKNILGCSRSFEATSAAFKITVPQVKKILAECYEVLYEERQERPKPHVDTKIVTAWNGLMISGFARAGLAFNEDLYTERAVLAANFVRRYLYDEDMKILLRCCYRGGSGDVSQISAPISGFVQDYAFLIRGLIDVYEATLDHQWLEWAEVLQDTQNRLFWDSTNFAYFTSPEGDPSIVMRDKEDQDGAEPSGNSLSVHNLIRLSAYMNRPDFKDNAEKTIKAFAERLRQVAIALPEMASALMHFRDGLPQIFIAGSLDDAKTQMLLQVVRETHMPGKLLIVADPKDSRYEFFKKRHELMANMKPIKGQPTVYLCRNFTCSLPVTKPEELQALLDAECQRKN